MMWIRKVQLFKYWLHEKRMYTVSQKTRLLCATYYSTFNILSQNLLQNHHFTSHLKDIAAQPCETILYQLSHKLKKNSCLSIKSIIKTRHDRFVVHFVLNVAVIELRKSINISQSRRHENGCLCFFYSQCI